MSRWHCVITIEIYFSLDLITNRCVQSNYSDNDDAELMRGSAQIFMTDNVELTDRLFDCLGEGGNITTPLAVQPWGDYFGKLTDRFGVQWMFNCSI